MINQLIGQVLTGKQNYNEKEKKMVLHLRKQHNDIIA